MVQRLDRLPDRQLVSEIQSIVTDFNALKTSVQFLGSDSVVMHSVTSGNTYDISQSIAAYASGTWRVVFTPTTMQSPFTELTYSYGVSGGDGYELAWFDPDVNNTTTSQSAWLFYFSADANPCTVNVLFGIKCPDTGSFTVTRIA